MSELPEQEREQIAQLLQRAVADAEFRALFQTDPAQAIESSGVGLSPEAAARMAEGMDLLPEVTAHAATGNPVVVVIMIHDS